MIDQAQVLMKGDKVLFPWQDVPLVHRKRKVDMRRLYDVGVVLEGNGRITSVRSIGGNTHFVYTSECKVISSRCG